MPEHQFNWLEHKLFNHDLELLLSPRDHGKTTTVPRVGIEWATLFNPDINVLLLSKTYSQSKKTLDLIYNDLKNNPRIQEDFSEELSDLRRRGNQLFYNMPKEHGQRDGTVESTGILGDITGAHFNLIIMDDILDENNIKTAESRQQIINQLNGTILPLLEPGCGLTGIGTRKNPNDTYQYMIDNPSWHVIEEKAIIKYPSHYEYVKDEDGVVCDVVNISDDYEVLWKEKWGIKELLLKSAQMGPLIFKREYQNEVNQLKGQVFKTEWLKHYQIWQDNYSSLPPRPPLEDMNIYQGIDLAISKRKGSDYFVITTIGVTQKPFRKYVLDWYRAKLSFPEQCEIVPQNFSAPINDIGIDEWEVDLIGIESNAYQVALAQELVSEWGLPIKEIRSRGNKETRLTAGSVDYANGVYQLPSDHKEYDNFLEEYSSFPTGEHDDILDSMDICSRLILNPASCGKPDLCFIKF